MEKRSLWKTFKKENSQIDAWLDTERENKKLSHKV